MSTSTLSPEEKFRIVLLGAARTGKTELCCSMLGKEPPSRYTPTVEDLCCTDLGHVSLQILDTAGAFAFPAMRRLAINSADVIVILYRPDILNSDREASIIAEEVRLVRKDLPPLLIIRNIINSDAPGEWDDAVQRSGATEIWGSDTMCLTANVRSESRRVLSELLSQAQKHEKLFHLAAHMAYTLTQVHHHNAGRRRSYQKCSSIAHDFKRLFHRRSH